MTTTTLETASHEAPPPTVGHTAGYRLALPRVAPPDAAGRRRPNTSTVLPLAEYDLIVVFYSGGKDSTACVLRILELCDAAGVPRSHLELWHHAVDGAPDAGPGLFDWRCTESYCRAVAAGGAGWTAPGRPGTRSRHLDRAEGGLVDRDAAAGFPGAAKA